MARIVQLTALLLLLLRSASAQCPGVCACLGDTVDCSPQFDFRFTDIPTDAPPTTKTLIMTGNALSTLPSGSFSAYPSLENLVLDDNLLESIPPEGLDSLPQLKTLSLDGNPLTRLDGDVFADLGALEELSIEGTPLTTINASAFSGLDSLQTLILDDNQLQELPVDLFSTIPQLNSLFLRGNNLQSLPGDLLRPLDPTTSQVDITGNPWSCDCYSQGLAEYLMESASILARESETVCLWPREHINQPITSVDPASFQCYAPSVAQHPEDADILTNRVFILVCDVDGAPFPEITWTKDGLAFNYTEGVYLDLYNGSLHFASVELEDAGLYQCFASNINGSTESTNATLSLTEYTCFDGAVSPHETDLDCGGDFCQPCNISQHCLENRDCLGALVCLYSHQLPSGLLYISPDNSIAYTCATSDVPPTLLEAAFQANVPENIFSVNFTGSANATEVTDTVRQLLALQLEVPVSTITSVLVTAVEKFSQPLYQVWFDLPKSNSGEQARSALQGLIDDGSLKATIRVTDNESNYRVRMNL